jgi:HEAT repeat protein
MEAAPDKQESLIANLKERKGVIHTEALAQAIPQLKGSNKLKARDALAERLARMTESTLREKFQDESVEIRRAAALACALKDDQAFVADLIRLLEDSQRPVCLAAHAALKELTRKDFGPAADAGPMERARAIAKWKEWWKGQAGK